MEDTYFIKNLILGQLFICTQNGGMPISSTYPAMNIFYKTKNKGKNVLKNNKKIVEVFTDDEFEIYDKEDNTQDHEFNKVYIVNTKSIKPYLTDEELITGLVSKGRILEIYNQINFEKINNNQKQLQK